MTRALLCGLSRQAHGSVGDLAGVDGVGSCVGVSRHVSLSGLWDFTLIPTDALHCAPYTGLLIDGASSLATLTCPCPIPRTTPSC